MYKLIIASLAIFIYGFLLHPATLQALDPGPRVSECWDEEKSGSLSEDCAQVLCSWDNIARNWPEDIGFNKGCTGSAVDTIKNNYMAYVVGAVITATMSVVLYVRWRKKRTGP